MASLSWRGGLTSALLACALVAGCNAPGPIVVPDPSPVPSTSDVPVPTSTPAPSSVPPTSTVTTPPVTTPVPTSTPVPPPVHGRVYPVHTKIVATSFWVGELFDPGRPDGSQVCSTYDPNWAFNWSGVNSGKVPSSAEGCAGAIIGGCDGIPGAKSKCDTEARTAANGFFPTKVTPKENPFYLDLPYDDLNDATAHKERDSVIPWAHDAGYPGRVSMMKNRWVLIVGPNGHTCFGQIEDAGPAQGSNYHDKAYVFGSNDARPLNPEFGRAGMDVSPALNGCLGFKELDGDSDQVSWRFVDDVDVPPGPWKTIVTTSPAKP